MRAVEEQSTALTGAALESVVRAGSRQGAKALAEAMLPASMIVWRGSEARRTRSKPGRIALTFDDGPTPLTESYLAILERLGVRATFFVVGEACAQYPELVEAIAARGHELANHGYTHRRFPDLTGSELTAELERTDALLPKRQTQRRMVRPPHGAVSLGSVIRCSLAGFTTVLWSFDSGDARNTTAGDVERAFTERTATAGEIVLLHEGQTWTMTALPTIVDTLQRGGHELVTVGELLG